MKKAIPKYFFLLLVLLVTAGFLQIIGGFIMAIFWAVTLTILFHERYDYIHAGMPKYPNLAAGLTVGLVLLLVIIPLVITSVAVINEADGFLAQIAENDISLEDQVDNIKDQLPIEKKTYKKLGLNDKAINEKIEKLFSAGSEFIANKALGVTQNIIGFLINFFLTLYIFFFFLRDGRQLVRELIWVIPMKDKQEMELLVRFESVTRATVKGSLVVALAQGIAGGVVFWALGIDAAFLWGIMMILASLLPAGSALIWGPWVAILLFQGHISKAIILLVIGAGFIGLIDNILRPRLVGHDTKLPDYLILISTLGGLAWFGLSGFVIGPIMAALFVTCWQMMGKEYGRPYNEVLLTKIKAKRFGKTKKE